MRFMMLMIPKGYEKAEPGTMPDAKAVAAMMKYNESLQKAGVLLALDGLHPPSMRVKPRRSRAIKPFPRPQKSSTISASRGHNAVPSRLRRAINFWISCSGVSKRRYAASQGSEMSAPGVFIFRLLVVFSICDHSLSTLPQVGHN